MRFIIPLLSLGLLTWQVAAAPLEDFLARMDKAAPSFTGMTSSLKKLTHTHVIDDNSEETGTFMLKRWNPKDLQVLIEFTKPDAKTVAFRGKKAEIYYPKMKTVQEANLGKQGDLVEQFLLLGFGSTGKELAANYDLKLVGSETVAGQDTVHLQMVPKDPKRREKLKQMDVWMSRDGTHPVQQKFLSPSGDYHVFTYTNAKLNPPLSEDALKLKVPKGTKRETI